MYIFGVVLVIAGICGSGESRCITRIVHPNTGIADGVEINANVEIACKCDTDTIQLESWYFNGSIITLIQSNYLPYATILSDGNVTLTIPNFVPSYAGNYTCISSNNRETTQVELTISQQLFSPPADVRVSQITADFMATVQWSVPESMSPHLSGYHVMLRWQQYEGPNQLSTVSNSQIVTVGSNITEYTFNNIQPYALHCIQVQSVYSYDGVVLGTRASRAPCFNSSTAAPSEPTKLHLEQLGSTFVYVSWNNPTHPNGPITNYVMYVDGWPRRIDAEGSQLPFRVDGLEEGTTYTLGVSAVTEFRMEGRRSNTLTITTLAADVVAVAISVAFKSMISCVQIMKNNELYEETLSTTNNTVSNTIQSQCDCDATIGLSHNTKLRCFPGDHNKIVFITTAYGLNESVQLIEQVVKSWPKDRSSSVSVTTSDNILTLTAVCLEESMLNTTCFVTPVGKSDDDDNSSNKGAIAGVIVTVIVIFILIIIVIVIVIIIYQKRRQSYNFAESGSKRKETSQGVHGRFNVSRLSQSLPAIFHTWRLSRVSHHSANNNYHDKNTNDSSISNDSAFASLTDKDATLRDPEVTKNNKSINAIMQCIQEDQVYSDIDDKGEYVQIVDQHGSKKGNRSLEHGETQTADNPHGALDCSNSNTLTRTLSNKEKHISPFYMEVTDKVSRGLVDSTISESGSESEDNTTDVYSVPIDSITNDNCVGEKVVSPQTKMATPKYHKQKSLTNPVTSRQNSTSPSTQQPQDNNDDVYSTPLDSLPRINAVPIYNVQDTAEEYAVPVNLENTLKPSQTEQDYTFPVLATMAMNLNPSYNSVNVKNTDVDGYCDPRVSMKSKNEQTHDSVFAGTVASLQRTNQSKGKPPLPKPYKPPSPSKSNDVFQSASPPSHLHNAASRSQSDAETQRLPSYTRAGGYIMPGTNSMKLKSTMSCGVTSDLYSMPIDSFNDDSCDGDKLASSFNRGKVKPSSSKANSLAKQTVNKQNSTSQPVQQHQDGEMYSVPVDSMQNATTDNMKSSNTKSPSPTTAENEKPPVPSKNKSEQTDSPFAEAVKSLQRSKQTKDKPSLPKPYKPQSSPSREMSPTTSLNLHQQNFLPTTSDYETPSRLTADDYIIPGNEATLNRKDSYNEANDSLEYSYVVPNQLRIPNFIDDVCTGHTEC